MKKAQSELFRVLMVAAIVIMLLFFGWRGIANIQKKSCDSRLAVFEAEIRSSVEAAATDTGSREEWKGSVPCGAEKIIFVDKSKDVSFEYFDSAYPEIYDTIFPERTRDNAFLLKGDKVVKSFYMGDIHIEYPYFDCYITKTGLIDFWIEGHGGDTKFLKLSDNFDCTFEAAVPVELSSEDEAEVLEDIGEVFTPMDTCEVTREFSVTLSGTEVKLTNCDQDNLYYEVIPKCARSELDDLGIFTFPVGMDQNYVLESDPIVMWNFNADQVVTYNLDSVIEESCKRGFAGVSDSEVLPDSGDVSTTALALGMIGQVGNLNTNLGSIHPKYAGQFNLVTTNLNDIQNNVPKAKEDAIERLDKMIGDLKKELVKPGADQVTINQAISQAEILKQNIQDY